MSRPFPSQLTVAQFHESVLLVVRLYNSLQDIFSTICVINRYDLIIR